MTSNSMPIDVLYNYTCIQSNKKNSKKLFNLLCEDGFATLKQVWEVI